MPKPSPRRLLPNLARCGLAVLGLALFGALAQPSSCAAAEEEYGAWFGTKPPREYPGKSVEVLREWDSDIEKPVMAVVMHETSADDKIASGR
ncbi:MAG: hypothetical protein Q4F72_05855 [Desulfovibrionaceae bacterium]|nr:hypothetical protein [Desulfovibrionaceae bacterium]